MDILYIVIPAYNEQENIEQVVLDWYPVAEAHSGGGKSRLLVIDDGSRDETYKILCGLAAGRPLLMPVTKKNEGHGPTVRFGYRTAVQAGADFIFQTDSDGQTLPSEFEPFWEARSRYDLLIGCRNRRRDGLPRIFVSKVLKLTLKMKFHVSVTDANTPYRLMRADLLQTYLPLIPPQFFLSNVLLTVIYTKKKRRIRYIPITFRPRQGGTNSINMKKILSIGRRALREFGEINREIDAFHES